MRERLGSFFSKSVASPKPQRTPTASPIASLQYRFHHNHHHQHHHHHHHPHHQHVEYHQLFNDLHPDNRLCFTSGQRFPVTIASLGGRGQEPSIILKQEDFVKKKEEPARKQQEDVVKKKEKMEKTSSRSGLSCLRDVCQKKRENVGIFPKTGQNFMQ